jgi:DNA-binding transcriptional MerR regulator
MEESVKQEKYLYSIGEIAEMFHESVPTIRFWESQFAILKPKKNKKGNRLFTVDDVKNLEMIVFLLRQRKLTIKGAIQEMKVNHEGISRKAELNQRLLKIKSLLSRAYQEME